MAAGIRTKRGPVGRELARRFQRDYWTLRPSGYVSSGGKNYIDLASIVLYLVASYLRL